MITLFVKPGCAASEKTKKFLDKNKMPYRTFDVTRDMGALMMMSKMKYKSTPVVVTQYEVWNGYNMNKLKTLFSE